MAFAHVTTSYSYREMVANELARKIEAAKTQQEVENILRDKINQLVSHIDRVYEDQFRLVNLMTTGQLYAYDEILFRLGKNASRQEWSQAINEWKEAQP